MKVTHLIAAATMIVGLGVSTAASAQDYRHDRDARYEYSDRRDDRRYDERRYDDRRRHDDRRGVRGGRYGWNRHHVRCRVEWRHRHRVRVCR